MPAIRCWSGCASSRSAPSNLDEFYSVRVAGLVGQAKAGLTTTSPDGRTPAQQLAEIRLRAESLLAEPAAGVAGTARAAAATPGIEVCEPRQPDRQTTASGWTPGSWSGSSRC